MFLKLYKKLELDKWRLFQRTTLLEQLIANRKIWNVLEAEVEGGHAPYYYGYTNTETRRMERWTWNQVSPTPLPSPMPGTKIPSRRSSHHNGIGRLNPSNYGYGHFLTPPTVDKLSPILRF